MSPQELGNFFYVVAVSILRASTLAYGLSHTMGCVFWVYRLTLNI